MFGRTKHLRCKIQSLEAAFTKSQDLLEKTQEDKEKLQSQLRNTEKSLEDSQETLADAESRIKGLEKTIQDLTDDNTALANTANARLSVLVGLKRYIDTVFEKENHTEDPNARPEGLTPPVKGKPYTSPPYTSPPDTWKPATSPTNIRAGSTTPPPGENDPNTGR